MRTFALRLKPGQDLRKGITDFAKESCIAAGFMMTCVGSVKKAVLRTADERIVESEDKYEIVSLVGTISPDGVHLHISLSDDCGNTIGGHLKEGCIIHTTAEIVIGEDETLKFSRKMDDSTGFKELEIIKKD